jgi:hypothetical protein
MLFVGWVQPTKPSEKAVGCTHPTIVKQSFSDRLQEGNAKRSRSPDTVREKSRSGVTAGRECFCNPGPLSL